MKVLLVVTLVTFLLLQNVASMGNNKNKGNGQNKGNGNQGQKVTLFPCHTRVLRAERIIGGPPGKSKNWNGFINVKNANKKQGLIVTLIFDFPTKVTVVRIVIQQLILRERLQKTGSCVIDLIIIIFMLNSSLNTMVT